MMKPQGQLVPLGGGDAIPLTKPVLTVGRRESCDICLRFPNVSSLHCELTYRGGIWYIRDLKSTNGVKVNHEKISTPKVLRPGDLVTIAKMGYRIEYVMASDSQEALEEILAEEGDFMKQSLLERAGLTRRRSTNDDD
ncbi:FHA domain-containing protein [Tuwongella immobilis]|uniref:FHA domain-containing protein n=1 Tax=Tuwongella immobilis TaxID=692036 RepID=A0A6C2YHA8_9BACT|nr:FHA domain-containing protein [Tuwongella immobilis]VIP00910.1 fha domain containing protein : FHA domain containing protein OS=Pirellula staleyi (strain ATCC 27377 / DSM 6068 / ICPB 4128) GN=Psta_3642 PE=4 SV=1: FHA [Tuwongella immobilis]VTR97238.1 fha domain containing protein : FHA domain containing protein OS=Pirellula staleyi (strain ATCC 27377 / DSM 6068 / ICPB 4128) GN=Psta_3642 PE=4 SV=1: FHA [Tuwongella immobilis]